MGIVTKQFHKRTTNRLVAPVRWVTALDCDEVLAGVRAVLSQAPQRANIFGAPSRMWLAGSAPGPWTIYFGPPSRREPGKVSARWQAQLGVRSSSSGAETMVSLQLVRWRTQDGALVARRDWELLMDNIEADIFQRDRGCARIDGV